MISCARNFAHGLRIEHTMNACCSVALHSRNLCMSAYCSVLIQLLHGRSFRLLCAPTKQINTEKFTQSTVHIINYNATHCQKRIVVLTKFSCMMSLMPHTLHAHSESVTHWISHIQQLISGTLDKKVRNYEWSHATRATISNSYIPSAREVSDLKVKGA